MIDASFIARNLGGYKSGRGWCVRCPAHDDENPSLSVTDENGKVLFYCHAGCSQLDVIEKLKKLNLWEEQRNDFQNYKRTPHKSTPLQQQRNTRPEFTAEDRKAFALKIWEASVPSANTLVETYLRSRCLDLSIPSSLRFHPDLKHLPSGQTYPCMVALITNGIDGNPMAIQRTYLDRDGTRKAPIESNKMMLGFSRGGVIRFGEPDDLLMIGEGIETSLSVMMANGNPTWSAISASGMAALELPQRVRKIIVLADGDKRGEEVAQQCARRWTQQGRKVSIARPPQGRDFNDLLLENSPTNQEGEKR